MGQYFNGVILNSHKKNYPNNSFIKDLTPDSTKSQIGSSKIFYKLPIDLIGTPMSKVTIEERDELLKQNEEMKKELEYIKKTTEKQMYINDLTNLRKELEKDFK